MAEQQANLARVELDERLGLLLLGPLFVTLFLLVARILRQPSGRGLRGKLEPFAIRSAWLGFAASALLGMLVARELDADTILLDAFAPALRIGTLDAAVALALDRQGAWLLSAIAAAFAIALVRLARPGFDWRKLLGVSALGFALLAMILADNFVYAWIGLFTVELARLALSRVTARANENEAAPGLPGGISHAALLFGCGLLFWGMAGSWSGAEFLPELRPRLFLVDRSQPDAEKAPSLSFTSLPGAQLRIGGALLCEVSGRGRAGGTGTAANPCRKTALAPFVGVPLLPGVHDLTISAGSGSDQLLLENSRIDRPKEIVLLGPSLVFREIRAAFELSDDRGEKPIARSFERARLYSVPLATWVLILFGVALGVRLGQWISLALAAGVKEALKPFEIAAFGAWLLVLGRVGFLLHYAPSAFAVALGLAVVGGVAAGRARARLFAFVRALAERVRRWDAKVAGLLALILLLTPASALATETSVVLRPAVGGAPLELAQKDGAYEAELVVENTGSSRISGLALSLREGTERYPLRPAGLSVQFEGGADAIALSPGESRRAVVRFARGEAPVREFHAHLLAAAAPSRGVEGASLTPLAALGVHAAIDSDFGVWHGLSLLLILPSLGLLGLGVGRLLRYRRLRALRSSAVLVAVAKLGVVAGLVVEFDPELSRLDGSGGYQFVERALISRSLGIEYFVGVDGFGLAALLGLALIGLLLALASLAVAREVPRYFAALFALDLALTLSVVAIDLVLLGLAIAGMAGATALFATGLGSARGPSWTRLQGAVFAGAVLSVLLGIGLVAAQTPPSYLIDGTPWSRASSVLELAQTGVSGGSESMLVGLSLIGLGLLPLVGAVPFQALALAAVRRVHPASAIALVGVRCALLHVLLRVSVGALPGAFAEVAPVVAWLGAASIAYSALAIWGSKDLVTLSVYAGAAQTGCFLLGLAGRTSMASQGAELVAWGGSLGLAGMLAAAMFLTKRLPSVTPAQLRGLSSDLPSLGLLGACSMAAAALLPLSTGFFGLSLVALGATPFQPLPTLVAVLACAGLAIGLGRAWLQLFSGSLDESLRKLAELEPHAGRLPALRSKEWSGLALLALASFGLGLWPRPLLRVTDCAAVDYSEPNNPPGPLQVSQTSQHPLRS